VGFGFSRLKNLVLGFSHPKKGGVYMPQNNDASLTIRYLLDSPTVSAYLLGRPAVLGLVHPLVENGEAATSTLVYAEVREYLKRRFSDTSMYLDALNALMEKVHPYPPSMDRYVDIRLAMGRPKGQGLIGDINTLIAATALENGLTLVTINPKFMLVPDLSVKLILPFTRSTKLIPRTAFNR
jgi:predicted nucleic acid-binding protein